jgi:hypothetical protein
MIFVNLNSFKQTAINVFNNEEFYTSITETLPFIRVDGNSRSNGQSVSPPVPTLWCFDSNLINLLETQSNEPGYYYFGFVKKLSHEKIDLFKAVETFNYSFFTSTIQNNVLKTTGSMAVPVLLPFIEKENHSVFMSAIWRVSAFTFVPFFIYTDLSPINIGGPLFMQSLRLSVSESSDVNCEFQFTGGALIPKSITGFSSSLPNSYIPQSVDDTPYDNMPTLKQNNNTYRSAKIYDCLLAITPNLQNAVGTGATNLYTNNAPLISWMSGQDFQIIEMSLNINQDIHIDYTANDGVLKNVLDGPAYISLKNRKVSGHITFISAKNLSVIYNFNLGSIYSQTENYNPQNATSMLMYFGGPFYYPMKNVVFQQFNVELNAAEATYKHTIEFFALLQPTKETDYYKQNIFDLDFNTIFEDPIDGTLKTAPQMEQSEESVPITPSQNPNQ